MAYFLFIILIILTGCGGVNFVGDYHFPDGSQIIYLKGEAGIPLIGRIVTLDRWQYDPKTNKTVFIRGDSSGQMSLPDLSKIPLAVAVP